MAHEKQKLSLNNKLDLLKVCQSLPHFHHELQDDNIKIVCKCPDHRDDNPSAFIDLRSRRFYCSTCKRSEFAITTLMRYGQKTKFFKTEKEGLLFFARFANLVTVDLTFVEQFHSQLMNDPTLQTSIATKGITEDLLREYRIGIHSQNGAMRYVIPVFSEAGDCIQCLTYLPNAPTNKMYVFDPENKDKKSSCQLFMRDQLRFKQIVICGGPLKAIVAAQELNKHDVGAVSFTTGEHAIPEVYRHLFADHIVYICYDIDPAGEQGATKALQSLLGAKTAGLYKLSLVGLDKLQYPKGDLTNYLVDEKRLLFPLLAEAVPFEKVLVFRTLPQDVVEEDFEKIGLSKTLSNGLYNTDIKCLAHSSDPTVFIHEMSVQCSRQQACCNECSIFDAEPQQWHRVDIDHPGQLNANSPNDKKKSAALKSLLNIPPKCASAVCYPESSIHANECKITSIRQNDMFAKIPTAKAFFIGRPPALNELFLNITGRRAIADGGMPTFLITKFEKASTNIVEDIADFDFDELKLTRPKAWTIDAIQEWYQNRYGYLMSQHRIYGRSRMNFLIDLTFHSVLRFDFNFMSLNGWLNFMVLGDSGTGKSTMLKKLFELYRLGHYSPQAQGSRAGWIGGLEKDNNGRQSFKPGILPLNDGGLICIEELKSLEPEVLQSFLTTMSDGVFSLTTIQAIQMQARVRLIFTSNARESHSLYTTPRIQLLGQLLGAEEALRRFDVAMALLKSDKYLDDTPTFGKDLTPHLLSKLIQFAWSIKANQVVFEDEAYVYIMASAKSFALRYQHTTLLLADTSSQHNKFARLAVAFACLTFSTSDDGKKQVIVRPCHIEFVVKLLLSIYDGEELGYLAFAELERQYLNTEFTTEQQAKVDTLLQSAIWLDLQNILNGITGKFDVNYFYSQFSDRQVAVGVFSMCREIGFIQNMADNRHFSITDRWRLFFKEYQCRGLKVQSPSTNHSDDLPF